MFRFDAFRLLLLMLLAAACGAPSVGLAEAAPRSTAAKRPNTSPSGARAVIGASTLDRVKLRWEAAVGGYGRAVAIDSAQGRVVASSGDPVRVYALKTGKAVGEVRGCKELMKNGLALTGRRLLLVCERALRLYDLDTLKPLPVLEIHPEKVDAVAISWPRVALAQHDGVIRIYDLEASAPPIEIVVPGPPVEVKSLALSPAGDKLAVAWVQGSIWWWETQKPAEPHQLVRHESESDAVEFNLDGSLFAEEGKRSQTTLWSFAGTPRSAGEVKNGDWVKRILFTKDSRCLVRGGSDGLEITEIAGPRRAALDSRAEVEDVALDAQGATLAAIDRDGRLSVWALR